MPLEVKVYKVKDFIRLNESGELNFERAMQIIQELAVAASIYKDHNILVDLRETTLVGERDIRTVLELALQMRH